MKTITFIDNKSVSSKSDKYTCVDIDVSAVLDSWKGSLFAFEWMNADGSLKVINDLPLIQREKRLEVELKLNDGQPLEKPVLGIGMLDTVEIGSGKATLLTLGAHNIKTASVHVPIANSDEFQPFLTS